MKFFRCSFDLFHEVVHSTKPGIFVGLDVRARYVGVAVGDLTFERAYPYCCVEKKENNIHQIATELRRLVTLVQTFVDDLNKTRILEGVKYGYFPEREKSRMKFFRCSFDLFHEVVHSTKPGIFFGLDVRARYVGVALGDLTFERAYPYCCVEKKENNIHQIATELRRLVTEWKVAGLIVGQPPEIPEYKTDVTLVQTFVDDLNKTRILEGVKYGYFPEREKSRRVDCLLEPFALDYDFVKINGKADAAVLLQDYLNDSQRYALRLPKIET
ncbi:hypothetical protein CTI12_AA298700 [Artemisia annua]|uniref:YqgF/RNase H-like domain-containing protein n=1 Tax=Artemisia annua TaxID=35608 RepID=A0A2U1N7R4_ARTAN|nr:hypothetical protein CTI12_AA298700 [Artemisia annua]